MKKYAPILLVLLVALCVSCFMVTGCGDNNSDSSDDPTSSPTPDAADYAILIKDTLVNEDGTYYVTTAGLVNGYGNIPTGVNTVILPDSTIEELATNTITEPAIQEYFYGNPAQSAVNVTDSVCLSYRWLKYIKGMQLTPGTESGKYTFKIGSSDLVLVDTAEYEPVMNVTAPLADSIFDVDEPLTFTWDDLGSNYVYSIKVYPADSGNTYSKLWSFQDFQSFNGVVPTTVTEYIVTLTDENSITMPGGIFEPGQFKVNIVAYNKSKTYYDYDYPYGKMEMGISEINFTITGE